MVDERIIKNISSQEVMLKNLKVGSKCWILVSLPYTYGHDLMYEYPLEVKVIEGYDPLRQVLYCNFTAKTGEKFTRDLYIKDFYWFNNYWHAWAILQKNEETSAA